MRTRRTTARARTIGLVLTLLMGACGGNSADDSEPGTSESTEESVDTTAAGDPDGSEETEATQTTAEPETVDTIAAGTGTATLTIGDMSLEFTGLACYYDAEAAEVWNDEDTNFVAVAQDGDTALAAWTHVTVGTELFEVLYRPGGDSGDWHMSSTEADPSYLVEDGRITAEDEFDLIIGTTETGTTEFGTFEATCG